MLTIKEIAERANVSRTTVSRVLNNSGYVSEEAKRRVLKVIEETGYIPSENAKSLRTKKTKVIGVILPKISTETSSRLVKGIDEILAKGGYQILLANTNLKPEKEIEYLKLLKSRHVDGIILSATNVNRSLIEEIYQLKIPFVTVGQYISGLANVVFDDYQAAKDMVQLLIKKGHKRIAFIGVDESDRAVGYLRKNGYYDAMKEAGLPVEDSWVQKGVFNSESGYESMKEIIEISDNRPTAVAAVTDRLAIGAMQFIQQMGLSIPEDMAFAGMGASELSRYITPSLTTIDFSMEDAGREAAALLLEQISREMNQEEIRTINYRLLERASI
ncbi:LacI family DNA-binding transcriptional regulator [Neobacillus niacini]|uniref:LacI family DNA-binding transcriptional regulator n=1 Tax=Neobacillus niacini TaxID=86668 RepID=UPI0021CB5B73|nr:LacI family DNA-binding transcriptional regulator [Neobacillus niacini]MCM3766753.1 LacI family transcriptional regulator [Neobacillus niacini]